MHTCILHIVHAHRNSNTSMLQKGLTHRDTWCFPPGAGERFLLPGRILPQPTWRPLSQHLPPKDSNIHTYIHTYTHTYYTCKVLSKSRKAYLHTLDKGGIEPGAMPPTSAWCPRDATKNTIDPSLASHIHIYIHIYTLFQFFLFFKHYNCLFMYVCMYDLNIGVMTVMSGRWLPPASCGWFDTSTSPSWMSEPQ